MKNPLLHTPSPFRVRQGGSWYDFTRETRVSRRYRYDVLFRRNLRGFRLFRTQELK